MVSYLAYSLYQDACTDLVQVTNVRSSENVFLRSSPRFLIYVVFCPYQNTVGHQQVNFLPVRTSKVMFFNMLSWVPIGKTMPLRRPESWKRVFHEPAWRHATKMSFFHARKKNSVWSILCTLRTILVKVSFIWKRCSSLSSPHACHKKVELFDPTRIR